MTEIKQNSDGFEIYEDGKKAGLILFSKNTSKITITHTEVDEAYSGKGLGKKLVDAAAKFAVDSGLKIEATCPYAKSAISKDTSYREHVVE